MTASGGFAYLLGTLAVEVAAVPEVRAREIALDETSDPPADQLLRAVRPGTAW